MSRENTILEETKIENKRLLSLISEINQENNNLKQQLADKQNQYCNYEIKVKTEEINSQYLMNDIKILREENKRIQDLYNNLAVNFSKLVTMMEQNTFDKSKSTSCLIRFRKVADSCLDISNISQDQIQIENGYADLIFNDNEGSNIEIKNISAISNESKENSEDQV